MEETKPHWEAQHPEDEPLVLSPEEEEEKAAAKRRSRLNAALLALVFILTALAPPRWRGYAPLLFLVPLVYAAWNRIRRARAESDRTRIPEMPRSDEPREEPYSYTPRDPKDPRRYKPIG